MAKAVKRLYNQFQPTNYKLEIQIDRDNLTFNGTILITGQKVGRPTRRLVFHQNGLRVTSAEVVAKGRDQDIKVNIDRILHHKKFDEIRLHSKQSIFPGKYQIKLQFKGKITDDMLGIYPSRFEHRNKKEIIIATQFESHHSREAFPCIDEPEAKATFDLTIITDKNAIVLSNTPIKKKSKIKKLVSTEFETTPKMSSYLLAFIAGNIHCVEGKTKDGIEVRSWSAISRDKKELQYANQEAIKFLEFYNDYFKTPYPLPKCDQVALPDFDSGAMENWGLITYREIALLTDPKNRSITSEQYVSLVIAHELSHQWFGNLVTMKWWDDLWLNESFASIMEYIALDAVHPDWKMWEQYMSADVLSATNRDIYKEIQPVGVKVTDPDIISTLFDPGIVYAKGGRLIKMVREYVGDEAFRAGLFEYFKKHAYSNSAREDLWNSLSKSSGKNVSKLLTPWIEQPGMPVIHVSQVDNTVEVKQERFTLDSDANHIIWPVPLLSNALPTDTILIKKAAQYKLNKNEYLITNIDGSGHFLTHYLNPEHRQAVANAVAKQSLSTEGRVNVLNDKLLLAKRGDISLINALDIVAVSHKETRDTVWALFARTIGFARQLTDGDKTTEKNIESFKQKIASDWYKKLGWDHKPTESPNDIQLRHTVISLMLSGKDKDALAEAKKRYKSAKTLDEIDSELRPSILAAVVKNNLVDGAIDNLIKSYKDASA
ncbi:M1 family metallopeptidase, partial [Candidatus Saccharibacteria bacterium]|nr:M1 family metallopeptidase [Candidatus Saccharibacteria bacterium]